MEISVPVQQVPPSSTTPAPDDSQTDEPQTRAELLRYYRHLTLDPNTAYRELVLSEGNRKAEHSGVVQDYPGHSDRFSHLYQVLCKEGLTGRCYWEVEFERSVEVAVAYEDLARSDYYEYNECAFGCNDKSWSLDINRNKRCFRYKDEETAVPEPQSSRIGVYLDHKAGILTYYCVYGTALQLMHREETTFTKPLYAGLFVPFTAQLCDLE